MTPTALLFDLLREMGMSEEWLDPTGRFCRITLLDGFQPALEPWNEILRGRYPPIPLSRVIHPGSQITLHPTLQGPAESLTFSKALSSIPKQPIRGLLAAGFLAFAKVSGKLDTLNAMSVLEGWLSENPNPPHSRFLADSSLHVIAIYPTTCDVVDTESTTWRLPNVAFTAVKEVNVENDGTALITGDARAIS